MTRNPIEPETTRRRMVHTRTQLVAPLIARTAPCHRRAV